MISITVNYQWSDYIGVLKEFAPISSYRDKNGCLPDRNIKISLKDKLIVYLLGSVMFAVKVHRVGACKFNFDKFGFQRKSNFGEKQISWESVTCVHFLSQSYLIELEQGFIPLPYKHFDESQKKKFEAIVNELLLDTQT